MQRKSTGAGLAHASRAGIFLILGLSLTAWASGCGNGSSSVPSSPVRPHQGIVLQVVCPEDTMAAVVQRYSRGWVNRTGAEIQVTRASTTPGTEPAPEADLWVVRPAALPYWVEAGQLQPLPKSYTQTTTGRSSVWRDLLDFYKDRLLKWKGQVYALPLLGEAPLCFYRSDLLGEAQHRQAFRLQYHRELAPPTTWDEFADIAEYFYHHRQPSGPAPSLPPLPESEDDLDREFQTMAASMAVRALPATGKSGDNESLTFSFQYELATGQPRLSTRGFVQALKIMQRLQPWRSPSSGAAAPEGFARGQAVLCLADASWISRFQKSSAHPAFGICRVPGSKVVYEGRTEKGREMSEVNYVPYLGAGAWLGVVSKNSSHAEAAFELLADLSGDEVSRQIVIEPKWGGGAFRDYQLADQGGWSSFDLDQEQTTALMQSLTQTLLHPGLANPVTCLRIPTAREHDQVLAAELRHVLSGDKDAATALKSVEDRWRDIDNRTPGRIRADYAHSLGLLPPP